MGHQSRISERVGKFTYVVIEQDMVHSAGAVCVKRGAGAALAACMISGGGFFFLGKLLRSEVVGVCVFWLEWQDSLLGWML